MKNLRRLILVLVVLIGSGVMAKQIYAAPAKPSPLQILQKKVSSLQSQLKAKEKTIQNYINLLKQSKDSEKKLEKKNLEQKAQIEEQIAQLELDRKDITTNEDAVKKLQSINSILYTDGKGQPVDPSVSGAIKWLEFRTAHLDLYFTPDALSNFDFILTNADYFFEQITSFYGVSSYPNRTKAYISFKEDVFTTTFAEYFYRTNTFYVKGNMYAPYNINNRENIVGAFIHELSHAVQFQSTLNVPGTIDRLQHPLAWLTEGGADYVDHQIMTYPSTLPEKQFTMRVHYGKEVYPDLIRRNIQGNGLSLANMQTLPDNHGVSGYEVFESIVYFLEQQYGHAAFLQFHKDLQTMNEDEACKHAFGLSNQGIMKAWKEYYGLE